MAFCTNCGSPIPAGTTTCPACASASAAAGPSPAGAGYNAAPTGAGGQVGSLSENVAGALAYVTVIPAILFLVLAPYNHNRFVRFHAFQSIFFAIACAILWIFLGIFSHIPFLGWASVLIWPLIWLAGFILWLLLLFKAYSGQKFKLPVVGDIAEQQASSV